MNFRRPSLKLILIWPWLISGGLIAVPLLSDLYLAQCLVASLILLLLWRFSPAFKSAFFALFLIVLGAAWGSLWGLLAIKPLPEMLIKKDVWVEGKVLTIPSAKDHALKFRFKIEALTFENKTYSFHEKILLNWYNKPFPQLQAGQRWRLKVRLKPAHGALNPGGFDYEKWLFKEGIHATGYVRETQQSRQLDTPSALSIDSQRVSIQHFIENQGLQYSGILKALSIGVRDGISTTQWQVFRDTGTAHLIAISGLHIGMISGIAYFIAHWFWRWSFLRFSLFPAKYVGHFFALFSAFIYAALAGFTLPTLRAFLMLLAYFSLHWIRRNPSAIFAIGFVLMVVLIFDPLAPLGAGMWLSFSAVIAIAWALKKPKRDLSDTKELEDITTSPSVRLMFMVRKKLKQWWRIQWAVFIALVPLSLIFFQQFSWVSILANAIAIPLVGLLVVPMVLLSIFMHSIELHSFAAMILALADNIFGLLWPILQSLSKLPFAIWQAAAPSKLILFSAFMGVIILLTPKFKKIKAVGALAFLPLLLPVFHTPNNIRDGAFEMHSIDVGQGLSVLVRTKNHSLLYDAGNRFDQGFDAGEMIVRPFLLDQNITVLDTIVVSHDNRDHSGGIPAVLEHFSAEHRYSSGGFYPDTLPCIRGKTWVWDDVAFRFLLPTSAETKADNNASCVLKISSSFGSALLTGDIEIESERRLLKAEKRAHLKSDVLWMPHHGSRSSSSLDFIKAVKPKVAIASAGYFNRFKHPHKDVLARYEDQNIAVLNSASSGWIKIKVDHQGIQALPWRAEKTNFWTIKNPDIQPLHFKAD